MRVQTRLISKKHVKAFTLEMAASRARKFTRVGAGFYLTCEAHLKDFIRGYVQRHPSKGKTIQ